MTQIAAIEIHPLSVGAEVLGLDCSEEIPRDIQARIYAAWLQYGFLVFRKPILTPADQMRLSRVFGELEMHPVPLSRLDEEPYLMELGGARRSQVYVVDGEMRTNALVWHRDTAYTVEVSKGAGLRLLESPPEDGETVLGDTAAAYDDLPQAMKSRIEGLECMAILRSGPYEVPRGAPWKTYRPATTAEWPEIMTPALTKELLAKYPPVVQPLVIKHPESGRKCLYISPWHTECVVGMPRDQSDALLDELVGHMVQDKYTYAHTWKVNEMMVWDNRRCIHRTPGYHPKYRRKGHRTTLAGSLKSGRFLNPEDAGKSYLMSTMGD